jgi:hypothetical protein
MEPLIHLDIDVDTELLLEEARRVKSMARSYTDNRYPEIVLSDWIILKHTSEYIDQLMKRLEINGSPRFYWLEPFALIPEHKDNGTQCSVNMILTDHAAPIVIGGEDFYYKQALLNTQVSHSVTNNKYERIMLKFSIFDESYEDLAKKIKYKKNGTIH